MNREIEFDSLINVLVSEKNNKPVLKRSPLSTIDCCLRDCVGSGWLCM